MQAHGGRPPEGAAGVRTRREQRLQHLDEPIGHNRDLHARRFFLWATARAPRRSPCKGARTKRARGAPGLPSAPRRSLHESKRSDQDEDPETVALALTDTLMLAVTFPTALSWDPTHAMPAAPMSPIALNVDSVCDAIPLDPRIRSLSARVSLNALPMSVRCVWNEAYSAASPSMSKFTCGGEHSSVACACAWQSPWQVAVPLQLSVPVHVGLLTAAEQEPWHSPMHVAEPGVYEHVPLHMPLHEAPAATLQLPVHMALHVPPENIPVHIAEHDPDALASQVPTHLPLHAAPVIELPSHMPVQLPPHVPEKLALQPASQVPVHIGAVHDPEHSPMHETAAVAVHEPLHVPLQAKLGAFTSHCALHDPLQSTTTSPPVQLAITSQLALASQSASQLACTPMSA